MYKIQSLGGGDGRLNYLYCLNIPALFHLNDTTQFFATFLKNMLTKLAAWAQTVNNDLLMCIPTCTEGQLHIASYLDR